MASPIGASLIQTLIAQSGVAGIFITACIFLYKDMNKKVAEKDDYIKELYAQNVVLLTSLRVTITEHTTSITNNTRMLEKLTDRLDL